MPLTSDQIQALTQMRQDNAVAGPPFAASAHWQEVVKIFEDVFQAEGIANPEESYLNFRFSGFPVGDWRLHRYVCWMYRQLLAQRDQFGLLHKLRATRKTENGFAYEMGDDVLSLDLLMSIDDFYNLYELDSRIATDDVVVGELGAGWGRLGFVLRSVNPRAVYVALDLPEVLLVSQNYLPRLLPADLAASYARSRNVDKFSRGVLSEADLWFMGPQDIERFEPGTVDFAVNIASFQEMPVEYVAEYMNYFSAVAQGGYCYLRQLYKGSSHSHRFGEIAGLDQYPFPTTWERRYLRPTNLSDEFFEAGFYLR